MSNFEPFIIKVDGQDVELTVENHGVAMFRHTPEYDYIDITEPVGPDEEEQHTILFRQRWLCLWMGRIALNHEDRELLEETELAHGPFFARTGFNSRVFIEDKASEFEKEMFTESLLKDLRRADGLPPDWSEHD